MLKMTLKMLTMAVLEYIIDMILIELYNITMITITDFVQFVHNYG